MSTTEVDTSLTKSTRRLALPLLTLSLLSAVIAMLGVLRPLAIFGLGLAFWAGRRAGSEYPNNSSRAGFLVVSSMVLLTMHACILFGGLEIGRNPSPGGNEFATLQLLGAQLRHYYADHGIPAPSLGDLVLAGYTDVELLRSGLDHELPAARAGEPIASSFVYRPGFGGWRKDPELILLHDRAPFWKDRVFFRFATTPGYCVLFADQRVAWLPVDEFNRALAADRARRAAIGWPVDPQVPAVRLPADWSRTGAAGVHTQLRPRQRQMP